MVPNYAYAGWWYRVLPRKKNVLGYKLIQHVSMCFPPLHPGTGRITAGLAVESPQHIVLLPYGNNGRFRLLTGFE